MLLLQKEAGVRPYRRAGHGILPSLPEDVGGEGEKTEEQAAHEFSRLVGSASAFRPELMYDGMLNMRFRFFITASIRTGMACASRGASLPGFVLTGGKIPPAVPPT